MFHISVIVSNKAKIVNYNSYENIEDEKSTSSHSFHNLSEKKTDSFKTN